MLLPHPNEAIQKLLPEKSFRRASCLNDLACLRDELIEIGQKMLPVLGKLAWDQLIEPLPIHLISQRVGKKIAKIPQCGQF